MGSLHSNPCSGEGLQARELRVYDSTDLSSATGLPHVKPLPCLGLALQHNTLLAYVNSQHSNATSPRKLWDYSIADLQYRGLIAHQIVLHHERWHLIPQHLRLRIWFKIMEMPGDLLNESTHSPLSSELGARGSKAKAVRYQPKLR